MKNIAPKKQKTKTNVFDIGDNPKFKPNQIDKKFYSYTATEDFFQIRAGDKIICRDYTEDEITTTAIVIGLGSDGEKCITIAACATAVFSIVVAFQREVEQ